MKQIVLPLLLLISIGGCASKTPFEMSKDGPTMKDNYESHISGVDNKVAHSIDRALENDINYQSVNERAYRRIKNPELEMFVYPHRVTKHGVIVPGYTIRFPMYEKVQYALVGDVAYEN